MIGRNGQDQPFPELSPQGMVPRVSRLWVSVAVVGVFWVLLLSYIITGKIFLQKLFKPGGILEMEQ